MKFVIFDIGGTLSNTKKMIQQPYPIPQSGKAGLLIAFGIGLFIAFFLLFFQPFSINNQGYSVLEILFFGVITFVVFFTANNILPALFPNLYYESQWTVAKQILFYLAVLLVIATLNGLYINYLNSYPFKWGNYLEIIIQTVILGILPISIYVLLSFNWRYSKMVKEALQLNKTLHITPKEPVPKHQVVQTKLKGETFTIDAVNFLFAKADGNYIEVYRLHQKPTVYRLNLSDFGNQISNNYMLRCHRSYFVNMKNVTGNAQGLKLWFDDEHTFIPVSRKYIAAIRRLFHKHITTI